MAQEFDTQLAKEIAAAQQLFKQKETEHNWQLFDSTLKKLEERIVASTPADFSIVVTGLKELRGPINQCVI